MTQQKQKTDKCRACGAEIYHIRSKTGRWLSLDVEPVWIRLDYHGDPYYRLDGSVVLGTPAGDADDDPDSNCVEVYQIHSFACPEQEKLRKKRKPRDRKQWKPIF